MSELDPTLEIEDLSVVYQSGGEPMKALRELSLTIMPGQSYGLVGESGSGKTTLALAVMCYLPPDGKLEAGLIRLAGQELTALPKSELRRVWGAELALVPQDPLSSLNPSMKIGDQVAESLRHHKTLKNGERRERVLELLEMVRLADPVRVAAGYPHQISGGMQQRVMIAMALGSEPRLLVLDEPTTGLDVTTEAAVLDLLRELIRKQGASTLYVSHNLGVVTSVCDRIAVLYASELVEDAPTVELYRQPLHPYTCGLLDSVPRLGENKRQVRLRAIKGQIPPLKELPPGCVFEPRCPIAEDICRQERPALEFPTPERRVRCHRWREIMNGDVSPRQPFEQELVEQAPGGDAVLGLHEVRVHFPISRTLPDILTGQTQKVVKAVDGVSLRASAGRTLGLVGESGSGKTTLARAVVGLVEKRAGEIELFAEMLPVRLARRERESLRQLQMVFQNPQEALNPYLTIGASLSRPLISLLGMPSEAARREVRRLLKAVRLTPEYARRFPAQLSGGEKQRVAIARAFAANPGLLVCDEPVSSLDVSVQASILNLLNEMQVEHNSSMLFISHDLAVVAFLADEVAVMYLGKLMELAEAQDLFQPPYHPYTEALLASIPLLDPEAEQAHVRLEKDVPSAIDVPSGCVFHTRCPRFLGALCVDQKPPWRVDEATGKRIYCHIPLEDLRRDQRRAFKLRGRES